METKENTVIEGEKLLSVLWEQWVKWMFLLKLACLKHSYDTKLMILMLKFEALKK